MATSWNTEYLASLALPPFQQLNSVFALDKMSDWPAGEQLNRLKALHSPGLATGFIDQSRADMSGQYYEEYIFLHNQIPTRERSWHDLYNALIWMLFPNVKRYLNRLHVEDITHHGLSPRSAKRNRITHFDECGIVLAYSDTEIPMLLAEHQWHQAFFSNRHAWGKRIAAFVFGHANYEMLMAPFIGLTGKWLGVEMAPEFFMLDTKSKYQQLDLALMSKIGTERIFEQPRALKPLPLLGIPGWHAQPQLSEFYANQDYFRPKRT